MSLHAEGPFLQACFLLGNSDHSYTKRWGVWITEFVALMGDSAPAKQRLLRGVPTNSQVWTPSLSATARALARKRSVVGDQNRSSLCS